MGTPGSAWTLGPDRHWRRNEWSPGRKAGDEHPLRWTEIARWSDSPPPLGWHQTHDDRGLPPAAVVAWKGPPRTRHAEGGTAQHMAVATHRWTWRRLADAYRHWPTWARTVAPSSMVILSLALIGVAAASATNSNPTSGGDRPAPTTTGGPTATAGESTDSTTDSTTTPSPPSSTPAVTAPRATAPRPPADTAPPPAEPTPSDPPSHMTDPPADTSSFMSCAAWQRLRDVMDNDRHAMPCPASEPDRRR